MKMTSELYFKAIEFATKAHKGVFRKGNKMPYIVHPMMVAAVVVDVKKSSNIFMLAIAAMLHDTWEDVEWVTLELIAELFGHQVAALVEELSSDKEQIKLMGKGPYLAQKMIQMSSYGLCIKLADRFVNIRDMRDMGQNFKESYGEQTYFILDELKEKRAKLTATHKKLIKMIIKELKTYRLTCQK